MVERRGVQYVMKVGESWSCFCAERQHRDLHNFLTRPNQLECAYQATPKRTICSEGETMHADNEPESQSDNTWKNCQSYS